MPSLKYVIKLSAEDREKLTDIVTVNANLKL